MSPTKRSVRALVLWGALCALGFPACAGRSVGSEDGGESHFLHRCGSSCTGDLDCISGVCTKPCVVGDEAACAGLAANAFCTADSGEPGAVAICDVGCVSDGDCSALGGPHVCDAGYCRYPGLTGVGGGGSGPVAGNGGSGGSSTGGTGVSEGGTGGTGLTAPMCETTIITSPEKNYALSSTLQMSITKVKPNAELTFDWGGVTADFRKRPVNLDDVDMVELSLWETTPDQFEIDLNNDWLMNPIVIAHIDVSRDQTSASVFELEAPSGPLDPATVLNYLSDDNYPPENHVYALMVAQGFEYGRGTYMMGGFQLDPSSDNTLVNVDSSSTVLSYSASIASRPATYIPAGTSDIAFDWTRQTTTAEGNDFIPNSITQLRIGMYDVTPAQLEGDNFLLLEESAVEMYEFQVEVGTKVNFNQAATKDGKPFAGIDDSHTWLVALNCGACQNPAPWYMSVLKPCLAAR